MASIDVTIPDALIPDLTQALALRMQDASDPEVKAVAAKVAAGQATTAAEKQTLARGFMKAAARDALLDFRAQQAAQAARDSNGGAW